VRAIGILDTSVLLELLRIPGRTGQPDQLAQALSERRQEGHSLLLPLAALIETGNHIGRLPDGNLRRQAAQRFVDLVELAVSGRAPFTTIDDVETEHVRSWCSEFVQWVTPPDQSMSDLSIKQAWDLQCALHQGRRVYIWTLDSDLVAYDRPPQI
jgi:hypothetical protein